MQSPQPPLPQVQEMFDRVIALLDYMYSDEGTLLINMGIEGTHYTMHLLLSGSQHGKYRPAHDCSA